MTDSYTSSTPPRTATGWTGWVSFGGIMLVLLGLFHAVEGLVAVFDEDYFAVPSSGLVVEVSYDVWGWVHFGLGVTAVVIGCGVLAGNRIAQYLGAILAGASAIIHLAFVPAYPVWSLIIITLDVFVIYALVAHGREMRLTD
ncbi:MULTISPECIES: DUF7144 family membrane protein [Amycolatopsis methanolica group]|uniref:Integral membrane protein n=1 Tax=Amycolatopsis methanolica 239 TaxID=1068978 RepID=A0A076N0L5_AMYME|nr:hypothetical protein [Amycolatopsis methanolica]AIJ23352.1 integral membrane protein [Amycolatopsis methanolica 239]